MREARGRKRDSERETVADLAFNYRAKLRVTRPSNVFFFFVDVVFDVDVVVVVDGTWWLEPSSQNPSDRFCVR